MLDSYVFPMNYNILLSYYFLLSFSTSFQIYLLFIDGSFIFQAQLSLLVLRAAFIYLFESYKRFAKIILPFLLIRLSPNQSHKFESKQIISFLFISVQSSFAYSFISLIPSLSPSKQFKKSIVAIRQNQNNIIKISVPMLTLENNSPQNKKILKDKVNNKSYIKGKLLGTGGFAKAYQAIDQQTGRLLAAKVIPKKSINQKRQRYKLLIQIKIHKGLKHKHIVQFIDAFQDKQNIYILLQYCRNYTLKDLVKRRKRLTEHETRMYVSQVVKALIYIHQQGTIHRDLKLGNILINDQMQAKICDFGLSTRIKAQGQVKKTICGTPNYIAPQILQQNGHSYQVDIWSIGVIMFTLLFGKPPFEDNTVEQTYENIKNNRYVFPTQIACTLSAKDLINRILVMDPAKRLSLQEILQHEFMKIPEGLSSTLPISSLAVPPLSLDKQPIRLNLNDIQCQNSEQLQGQQEQSSINVEERVKSSQQIIGKKSAVKKNGFTLPFIAIRQVFLYQGCYGYLLTNGIVGMFIKKFRVNFILQFGQQHYYILQQGKKPQKHPVPSQNQQSSQVQRLLHFKSYYNQKYSLFKLQQMNKRSPQLQNQKVTYMLKCFNLTDKQILTRLSNAVIQLHFADFSSLIINRNDQKGIYYINERGKHSEINYNQCKSLKLKTKIRRFSNLIQKLSSGEEQDDQQEENDDEQYDEESRDDSKRRQSDSEQEYSASK